MKKRPLLDGKPRITVTSIWLNFYSFQATKGVDFTRINNDNNSIFRLCYLIRLFVLETQCFNPSLKATTQSRIIPHESLYYRMSITGMKCLSCASNIILHIILCLKKHWLTFLRRDHPVTQSPFQASTCLSVRPLSGGCETMIEEDRDKEISGKNNNNMVIIFYWHADVVLLWVG